MKLKISPTIPIISLREKALPVFLIYSVFVKNNSRSISKAKLRSILSSKFSKRTVDKYLAKAQELNVIYSYGSNYRLEDDKFLRRSYYHKLLSENDEKTAAWFYALSGKEIEVERDLFKIEYTGKTDLGAVSLSILYFCTNSRDNLVTTFDSENTKLKNVRMVSSQKTLADYLGISLRCFTLYLSRSKVVTTKDCVYEIKDAFNPEFHDELVSALKNSGKSTPILLRKSGCIEIQKPSIVESKYKVRQGKRISLIGYRQASTAQKLENSWTAELSDTGCLEKGTPDYASNVPGNPFQRPDDNIFFEKNVLSLSLKTSEYEGRLFYNALNILRKEFAKQGTEVEECFWDVLTFNGKNKVKELFKSKAEKKFIIDVLMDVFGRYRVSNPAHRKNRHDSICHANMYSNTNPIKLDDLSVSDRDNMREDLKDLVTSEGDYHYINFADAVEVYAKYNPSILNLEIFAKRITGRRTKLNVPQKRFTQTTWGSQSPQLPEINSRYAKPYERLSQEAGSCFSQLYDLTLTRNAPSLLNVCRLEFGNNFGLHVHNDNSDVELRKIEQIKANDLINPSSQMVRTVKDLLGINYSMH